MELFRDTGSAKLPACIEFIKDRLECDGKFIVFGHHVDILDGICHALTKSRIKHIRIDGSTASNKRSGMVNVFQTDPEVRVAVLSILACGAGLTLTEANTVIFSELFWNPGQLRQCEDRAHRIGQKDNVNVVYLVAKGTIDEYIWNLISHKLEVLGETLDGQSDQLDLESSTNSSIDPNQFEMDSFLQYLLEKVDGYDNRKEAMDKRKVLREKKRRRGQCDDDENDAINTHRDQSIIKNPTLDDQTSIDPVFETDELPQPQFKSKLSQFAFHK